jgi:hypothetical protein
VIISRLWLAGPSVATIFVLHIVVSYNDTRYSHFT